MNALHRIVEALGAERRGAYYVAACPAHDDRNPSLSIRETDGKILVHCHAGCSQRDVIDELKIRGVWGEPAAADRKHIVAEYAYTDEAGGLLYQVVRFEPKDFLPRRPDGHGGWIYRKHPRQVLYHLPEVLEAAIVFVVEGERDVETLRSYGFVATTNAGGAKASWLPQFTEALCGREVILMPDADTPGRERCKRIAKALWGQAARIIWWEPEGAKDVSEWFAQGHSEAELIECITVDEEVHQ